MTSLVCTALCDLEGRSRPWSYLALSRTGWRDRPGGAGFSEEDASIQSRFGVRLEKVFGFRRGFESRLSSI